MNFNHLHQQNTPLLIANVWDVASANSAEKLNYQAIGTSSGAIATMLGYSDGEGISFQELRYIVERITASVNLPLSVDLEAGYSRDPSEVANHILELAELGVVGINIEDSIVGYERTMMDADVFSDFLKKLTIILKQKNQAVFINVRTDSFLLNLPNPVEETIRRAKKYQPAGAMGLFLPCIEKPEDIKALIQETELPLNVMCMPNLPSFEVLKNLGVKRISMGNFVYNKMNTLLEKELENIFTENSFKSLFV